jgi:hypothetical protein
MSTLSARFETNCVAVKENPLEVDGPRFEFNIFLGWEHLWGPGDDQPY